MRGGRRSIPRRVENCSKRVRRRPPKALLVHGPTGPRRTRVAKSRPPIDRTVVAQLGQPVLRTPAVDVSVSEIRTPEFQAFLARMHDVLHAAGGVGLAAPQVFRSQRVFLAALPDAADPDELVVESF